MEDTIIVPRPSTEETKNVSANLDTGGVSSGPMDWLRERLRELGKTGAEFGRALGVHKTRVYEMQRGDRRLQPEEIGPAARFLEWTEADVVARLEGRTPASRSQSNGHIAESAAPAAPDINKSVLTIVDRDITPPVRSTLRERVPVMGTVSGGAGAVQMSATAIDYVRCPSLFEGRGNIFALYVEDVSMVPAFRPGSLIFVDRTRPPSVGDDIVVELHPGSPGEDQKAILKRMVAKTGKVLRLEQHNPAKIIEIPVRQVIRMYRVMTMMDLFGV